MRGQRNNQPYVLTRLSVALVVIFNSIGHSKEIGTYIMRLGCNAEWCVCKEYVGITNSRNSFAIASQSATLPRVV